MLSCRMILLFSTILVAANSVQCQGNKVQSNTIIATVSTIAGDTGAERGGADGQGNAVRFWDLGQMVYDDRDNKVYFIDDMKVIRSLDQQNKVSTYSPADAFSRWDVVFDIALAPGSKGGTLYVVTKYNRLYKIEPVGATVKITALIDNGEGNATGDLSVAKLDGPHAITTGRDGNTYLSNTYYNTIRKLSFTQAGKGTVEPFAGKSLVSKYDTAYPFNDGQGETATFGSVADLVVDKRNDIYVADYDHNSIRKITPSGKVTSLFSPQIVSFDKDGSLAIAATHRPKLLAPDTSGNLYFVNLGLNASGPVVRAVVSFTNVITVAGNNRGYKDGPGKTAAFGTISGMAVSPDGKKIYIADAGNNVIRRIDIR
jgi:hypothetical protein